MFDFSYVPSDGVIFIDNSAITSNLTLEDGRKRITQLRRLLYKTNNLTSIDEVAEEVKQSINSTRTTIRRKEQSESRISSIKMIYQEKRKIYHLLIERSASSALSDDLALRVNQLFPTVLNNFNARNGITNELQTDPKLITYAIAYAETMPVSERVYIWSKDSPLNNTFKSMASRLNLTNTAIVDEELKKVIPCIADKSQNIVIPQYRVA
jgi:hypothetical protein